MLSDCSRKADRASRYTYGYSTSESITTAPPSERTSGNQYSRGPQPVTSRTHVCNGPENCRKSVYAYAMTYAGIAIGRSSAHSNPRRPGNRHMTVSHAVETPPMMTP